MLAPALKTFIQGLPKAELHIHIEGALEPELMFALASRNGLHLDFNSVAELRRAYTFTDLQSFLDIYYEVARVLLQADDYFDLAWSYLEKARRQNVRHAEIFFDPQTHTDRGIPFETILSGLDRALTQGREKLGLSTKLIMCFLRDRGPEARCSPGPPGPRLTMDGDPGAARGRSVRIAHRGNSPADGAAGPPGRGARRAGRSRKGHDGQRRAGAVGHQRDVAGGGGVHRAEYLLDEHG